MKKLIRIFVALMLVIINVVTPFIYAQENSGEGNGVKEATLLPGVEIANVLAGLPYTFSVFRYGGSDGCNDTSLEAPSLISLPGSEYPVYIQYVGGGVVDYCTEADKIYLNEDSSQMFDHIQDNIVIIDTTKWDTSKVKNMSNMFAGLNIKNIDVSNRDTSNVTDMIGMFQECSKLEELDLSNWDFSSLKNAPGMFLNCSKLKTIYSTTNINVSMMSSMFDGCTSLVGGNGTEFDSSKIDGEYARIDRGQCEPGYFSTYNPEDDKCPDPIQKLPGNITYTDTNGKVFPDIGTITVTSGDKSITMLDRNLGATTTGINNSNSYGYHFQWGNNYGFTRVGNESDAFLGDETTGSNYLDTSTNAWNNPYVSSMFVSDTEGALNLDLWGGENDYEGGGDSSSDYKRQGPCPAGYHVPSYNEWNDLLEMYNSIRGVGGNGNDFLETFNIPLAGARFLTDITVHAMNMYANLWSSSTVHEGDQRFAYMFIDNEDIINWDDDPGYGKSVRCFKDHSDTEILILEYDTNGGSKIQAQTIPDGEHAYLPGYTTHKNSSYFLGWFNKDGQKVTLEMGNPSNNFTISKSDAVNDVVTVHAKWGYNVKFLDWDGAKIKEEGVEEGKSATAPDAPTREGYIFNGWDVDFSNITSNLTVTAQYKKVFTVTWKNNDGTVLLTTNVAEGNMPSYTGPIPAKASTSDYTYTFNGKWLPQIVAVTRNTEYTAQFDATPINKGSNYSGGGGRRSSTNSDKQHGSAESSDNNKKDSVQNQTTQNQTDTQTHQDKSNNTPKGQIIPKLDMEQYNSKYSLEQNQAYQFSYVYGITNKKSISKANMEGKLTRIQMAKMLSYYAMNVLGQEPDVSKGTIKFKDVTNKMNKKYDNAVTLAYELGIMGINMKNNRFRPNDIVTRAEFVTALSRMLYGTKDGTGKTKYYEPHMAKLYNEGIITKKDPKMKEKRGYVMIMLMRTVE